MVSLWREEYEHAESELAVRVMQKRREIMQLIAAAKRPGKQFKALSQLAVDLDEISDLRARMLTALVQHIDRERK